MLAAAHDAIILLTQTLPASCKICNNVKHIDVHSLQCQAQRSTADYVKPVSMVIDEHRSMFSPGIVYVLPVEVILAEAVAA